MNQFELLWEYMQEDMKADRIASDIKRSPLRQKLEKTRDFFMEQQKAYKQIEEQVAVHSDRKDMIRDALQRSEEQLKALEARFQSEPPTDLETAKAMMSDVDKCRRTIISYETEMRRINKESNEFDAKTRSILHAASQAKQEFEQLKVAYDKESKEKKTELETQRKAAEAKLNGIPESLLAEYNQVKKRVAPPVARLVSGQCTGCNTSLPSAVLRKIEEGAVIECETCGRLLIK